MLRSELYNNLTDYLHNRADERIGQQFILPSSFIGSPRNMHQNYFDAMAIVQKFGKPSLFITMTCNPNWPEIKNNLSPGEHSNFRPDITVRVFHSKLKCLIDSIIKKKVFGEVEALIYTIEFQKRGLPHAHILVTLKLHDSINLNDEIDRVVSAEIPDPMDNPVLYENVRIHMMHGPCGNKCMRNGMCSKKFPKPFTEATNTNLNGYPDYKRPDNGRSVDIRGFSLNNGYVVPYNPYLLQKFNCHLNVEVCTTVKSIKYIYKYIHKGFDSATVRFARTNDTNTNRIVVDNTVNLNEIESFIEAAWRIFEYEMHYQTHTIIRLDCHLNKLHLIMHEIRN